MEPTFYEDSRYRGDLPSRGTKRPMTLDLNAVKSSKKPRVNSLLTSPDFHKLKLESPELENLIIQQQLGMGPTSASQCMYPKTVQQADDAPFPRDFPDALGGLGNAGYNLYQPVPQPDISILPPPTTMSMVDVPTTWHNGYHHQQQQQAALNGGCNNSNNPMVSSTMSSNSYGGYYGLSEQQHQQQQALVVSVKEEPQTVPCASPPDHEPPRSPIDMEDQERMKLERKRLRNRIAASKCRRRKLEKIARLEDRVSHLKSENSDLLIKVTFLKDQVCHLKQQVMEHVRSGCDISTNSIYPSYDEL